MSFGKYFDKKDLEKFENIFFGYVWNKNIKMLIL